MAPAPLTDAQYEAWGLLPPATRRPIPLGGPQDIASLLDAPLARAPDREAIAGRFARYSYAEVDAAINGVAAGLAGLGFRRGDHIACSTTNHPDITITCMAVMRLGGVWIGIPPKLAAAEKAYIVADSEARFLVADPQAIAAVTAERELPHLERTIEMAPGEPDCAWGEMLGRHRGAGRPEVEIDPWAPAMIAYTSGTTGHPKGVVHTQHSLACQPVACTQLRGVEFYRPDKRQGAVQSMAIINSFLTSVLNTWLGGGSVICVDRNDAEGVAEWIARERIDNASLASATIFDLLNLPQIDRRALDSLRHILIGGGPTSEELRAQIVARFGVAPLISYGLTEAPGQIALSSAAEPNPPGATGYAHPHVHIAILDPEGRPVARGEEGEVCVRAREEGPYAGVHNPMLGYWRRPEATHRALRGGWLHTGDIGFMDAGGYITLRARMNDVIVRGGANIYPAEIERVLGALPGVRAAAVVGRPDARLGETVEAFIQPMPGVRPDEALRAALEAGCRDKLARYKTPLHWTFVAEMPRNAMNKIVKGRLRDMAPARG